MVLKSELIWQQFQYVNNRSVFKSYVKYGTTDWNLRITSEINMRWYNSYILR